MADSDAPASPKREGTFSMVEDRKCTDILFFILYILFVIGFIVIMVIGFVYGDPYRLVYPTDYTGKTCRGDREDLKAIVYPRLEQDIFLNSIQEPPKTDVFDMKFYGICVKGCDQIDPEVPKKRWVCEYDVEVDAAMGTKLDMCNTDSSYAADCGALLAKCYRQYFRMQNVFYRCVPMYDSETVKQEECVQPAEYAGRSRESMGDRWDLCQVSKVTYTKTTQQAAQSNFVFDRLNKASSMWGRYFGDLRRTWLVVLVIGVVVAMLTGFVWLFIMKCCAGVMVWLTVLLVVLLAVLITFYLYFKAGLFTMEDVQSLNAKIGNTKVNETVSKWEKSDIASKLNPSEDNEDKFKYLAWAATAVTLILLLLIAAMRQKINTAITIIREASKAIRSMKWIVGFPFVIVALLVILLVLWVFVTAYLASAGEITPSEMKAGLESQMQEHFNTTTNFTSFDDYKDSPITKYLILYVFFGLLWTNQLIQALGMCTIAGAISYWYWHDEESIPNSPVWASFKRSIRYHFGSLCFGSFLIAFMDFLRVLMAYVDRRTKSMQDGNRALRCLMKIVQCILWCFTKCLKFINKNAYIMIAMEGKNFCRSTANAVKLILDNMAEMATVNVLSSFVLFLGKMFVTCFCGMLSFAYLVSEFKVTSDPEDSELSSDQNQISSQWLTVMLTMVFAYFVASAFMYVYDMAIDTILLCFCQDKKMNLAAGRNLHRQEMHDLVSKSAKEHAERGKKKRGGRV